MSEQDTPISGQIPAGTKIRLRFSYYSILYVTRLAEGDILSACAQSGSNWQPSLVSYDYSSGVGLSESGSIYATMINSDDANNVINECRNAFRTFNSIVGVNISEIDQVAQTSGFPITLVAVVVILIILTFIAFRLHII